MQDGNEWYNVTTLRTVIQAAGRIVRSEDDYGRVYILDGSVHDLLRRTSRWVPDWFAARMKAGRDVRFGQAAPVQPVEEHPVPVERGDRMPVLRGPPAPVPGPVRLDDHPASGPAPSMVATPTTTSPEPSKLPDGSVLRLAGAGFCPRCGTLLDVRLLRCRRCFPEPRSTMARP